MGGYKDDVVYSWWNAGDIFVRLRGEAVLPDTKSTGSVTNLKANDTASPEADISFFLDEEHRYRNDLLRNSSPNHKCRQHEGWRHDDVPAHGFAAIPL